jgi:hypothetical protein
MQQTIDKPRVEGGNVGCSRGIINLLGKGEGAIEAKTVAAVIVGTIIVTIGAVIIGAGARTVGVVIVASITGMHSICYI